MSWDRPHKNANDNYSYLGTICKTESEYFFGLPPVQAHPNRATLGTRLQMLTIVRPADGWEGVGYNSD